MLLSTLASLVLYNRSLKTIKDMDCNPMPQAKPRATLSGWSSFHLLLSQGLLPMV